MLPRNPDNIYKCGTNSKICLLCRYRVIDGCMRFLYKVFYYRSTTSSLSPKSCVLKNSEISRPEKLNIVTLKRCYGDRSHLSVDLESRKVGKKKIHTRLVILKHDCKKCTMLTMSTCAHLLSN